MFNFLLRSDFSLEGKSSTINQNDDIFVCPVQSHVGEPIYLQHKLELFSSRLVHVYTKILHLYLVLQDTKTEKHL